MRIQNIQNKNYSPNFGNWNREVFKTSTDSLVQELKHRNDTQFYRDGGLWYNIVKMLTEKYKNVSKVNTYCYGCSNGSEPYTFLMELMSICKKDVVQKFLPIIAKDYDEIAIEVAKKNVYAIGTREADSILTYTGRSLDYFLNNTQKYNQFDHHYSAKPILTDNVQFSVADVLEDYKNIKPDNTVVFARNFWPYLSDNNQKELANNLYQQLGKNSTLIIGNFDLMNLKSGTSIPILLWNAGFNPTDSNTIFVKP